MSMGDRIRLKRAARDVEAMVGDLDDIDVFGDSQTTALATGGLAEILSAAGKIGAAAQKAEEDKKKAEEDKKKSEDEAKKREADVKAAQAARETASKARQAALAESSPNGPLHFLADEAEKKAAQLEAKAGINRDTPRHSDGGGMPTWGWVLIGLGGVGLVGTVVALAVRKK